MALTTENLIVLAAKTFALAALLALVSCNSQTGPQAVPSEDGTTTVVTFYSPDIARVVKYPGDEVREDSSFVVTMTPELVKISRKETKESVILASSSLKLEVSKATGEITFYTKDGEELVKDLGCTFTERTEGSDAGSYIVGENFALEDDEAIYGLGYDQSGKMSLRGHSRKLVQLNSEDVIPFVHSIKGYGILWDNNSSGTQFTDDEEGMHLTAEVGDCIDYYVVHGGNADGVIAGLRELTGHVPMLPLWSYGFWQSRERYKTQDELLEVLSTYRNLGIPIDGIIQDWRYWGEFEDWNAMKFLDAGFPDPQAMIDSVHASHAHMIISVWPDFGINTDAYAELAPGNHLYPQPTWPPVANVYDAFSDEANSIYWKHLKGMSDMGIDGWWMDASEPEIWTGSDDQKEFMTAKGSIRKVGNAYPLLEVGNVYKEQRKARPDKRVFILTRSVYAGQQRYGAHTWTGDTDASWETLRNQVAAALNYTLSGNPEFNCDLGAFTAWNYDKDGVYGTAVNNRNYRELYTRWVEFGTFCSMMRSHGTDTPREIYLYGTAGEPVYDALVKAVKLRYTLLPYLYSTSWKVSSADASIMRGLMMDFPKDRRTWDLSTEFMFGKSLLVAPVLEPQFTSEAAIPDGEYDAEVDFTGTHSWNVYLPEGKWYDFFTEAPYEGGADIEMQEGLADVPLFVRGGSIIPMGPDVQYVGQKDWSDLEVVVYPGADGTFTLYEDEGDGYNYEQSKYSTIEFEWNDAASELVIGPRIGSFDGMLSSRAFRIRLAGTSTPVVVNYDGAKTKVQL